MLDRRTRHTASVLPPPQTGVGINLSANPLFLLRILQRDGNFNKAQIGGALAATAATTFAAGAFVAPSVGSALVDPLGIPWLTTAWALVYATVFGTCWLLVLPYNAADPPDCIGKP